MRNKFLSAISLAAMIASSTVFVAAQSEAAPLVNFPATPGTLGAIPDGAAACAPSPGAARVVSIPVTGIAAAPSSVSVNITLSPAHTWAGDIIATLAAPNGTSFPIFGRTGSTTAAGVGDSSDIGGPYTFNDAATGGWWAAATAAGPTVPIPAGSYRTSQVGGAGSTGAATNLTAAFAGIPTSNGTWTLSFTDGCSGDIGSVSAASLDLTGVVTPINVQNIVDFNGDGRTDWSVVRNTGGGAGGQITWFNQFNGVAGDQTLAWGSAGDFFVPGDYDGDNKTDVSVWRPGAPGAAAWYTLLSGTNTIRIDQFGQTGDDPTVIGDYNNDGSFDIAVYREGATAGAQSTWFYRTVANGPVTFVPWGSFGDFPAPGDYDGDGRNDFSVQRNGGGGQAVFITLLTTGPTTYTAFGTPTDIIVPGDYDGDGKTDYATARGSGGVIQWFYLPSSGGGYAQIPFGNSATDFPVQGDYDGDGKTDVAVWRPNVDPTQNFFFVNRSNGSGLLTFEWGQQGDYPVANYNTH